MSEQVEKVTIALTLKDAVSGPAAAVKAAFKEIKASIGQVTEGTGDILGTALGFAGGFGIIQIADKLIEAGKEAITQGREAEQSAALLGVALDGNLTRIKEIQEAVEGVSKSSVFGTTELTNVAQSLLERGVAFERIPKAMQVIADTASALRKPLDQVAISVATTFGGTVPRELGRAVPALKELTVEALKSGDAIDVLSGKFGGRSAEFLSTGSGKEARALTDIREAWEKIGQAVIPLYRDVLLPTANALQYIADSISETVAANSDQPTDREKLAAQARDAARRLESSTDELSAIGKSGVEETSKHHAQVVQKQAQDEFRQRSISLKQYLDEEESATLAERKRVSDELAKTHDEVGSTRADFEKQGTIKAVDGDYLDPNAQIKLAEDMQRLVDLKKKQLDLTAQQNEMDQKSLDIRLKATDEAIKTLPGNAKQDVSDFQRGRLSQSDLQAHLQTQFQDIDASLPATFNLVDKLYSPTDAAALKARLLTSAQDAKEAAQQITTGVRSVEQVQQEASVSLSKSAESGIANTLTQIETRAKTVKEALVDMVQGFTQAILNLINQRLAEQIVGSLSGGTQGGGVFGFIASLISGAVGSAAGGAVGGDIPDGNPGSDSVDPNRDVGGHAAGGYTGNMSRRAIAGFVHGQEFVAHANATAKFLPALRAMNAGVSAARIGAMMMGPNMRAYGASYSPSVLSGTMGSGGGGQSSPQLLPVAIVNEELGQQVLNHPATPRMLADVIRKNPSTFRPVFQAFAPAR